MAAASRVLIISQHSYHSNPTLRRNVDYLADQHVELDVLCTVEPGRSESFKERAGVRLWAMPLEHRRSGPFRYVFEYLGFFLWALPRVWRLALAHRYTAVQVDNVPDFLVFLALPARLTRSRIVFFMYELMPELMASRMKIPLSHPAVRALRLIERLAARWADRVVVVNEPCRRILDGRVDSREHVLVVPNTQPSRQWPEPAPPPTPVIITHSTLVERYGVQVAIRAIPILLRDWPDLVLRIMGEGEYLPALRALAAELGVAKQVHFLGYMPWLEAMAELRRSTVGLVPVIADGYGELLLPNKLLDYVSQRVPAVCSRLETIVEYFPEDAIAYFEPGDEAGLAEQVTRLLRDPAGAAAQAERAQAAFRMIAWERVSPVYLEALGATS